MSSAPLYAKSVPNQDRGLDAVIWQQNLQAYVSNDPLYGIRFSEHGDRRVSLSGTTTPSADDRWSVADSAAAGGTYSLSNVAGADGELSLNSTGTTNHFGVEAQGPAIFNLPTHASDARGDLVFQARVDFGDADTIFVGLSESGDNFLSSTSQLPDADYIGFYTEDNGTTVLFVNDEADSGAAQTYDVSTYIQSSGYQNLSFRVNKRDNSVELSVNGYWLPKRLNGVLAANLPNETLCPRLSATAGGGTTAPTIDFTDVDVFMAQG